MDEWMDGRPSTRQVDSARSACYQDAYLLPYEQPTSLLAMSSLRAATTRCSSWSSVAPPLPSRSMSRAFRSATMPPSAPASADDRDGGGWVVFLYDGRRILPRRS